MLEKDRRLRYRTASDLPVDLQRLKRDFDSGHGKASGGAQFGPPEVSVSLRRTDESLAASLRALELDPPDAEMGMHTDCQSMGQRRYFDRVFQGQLKGPAVA